MSETPKREDWTRFGQALGQITSVAKLRLEANALLAEATIWWWLKDIRKELRAKERQYFLFFVRGAERARADLALVLAESEKVREGLGVRTEEELRKVPHSKLYGWLAKTAPSDIKSHRVYVVPFDVKWWSRSIGRISANDFGLYQWAARKRGHSDHDAHIILAMIEGVTDALAIVPVEDWKPSVQHMLKGSAIGHQTPMLDFMHRKDTLEEDFVDMAKTLLRPDYCCSNSSLGTRFTGRSLASSKDPYDHTCILPPQSIIMDRSTQGMRRVEQAAHKIGLIHQDNLVQPFVHDLYLITQKGDMYRCELQEYKTISVSIAVLMRYHRLYVQAQSDLNVWGGMKKLSDASGWHLFLVNVGHNDGSHSITICITRSELDDFLQAILSGNGRSFVERHTFSTPEDALQDVFQDGQASERLSKAKLLADQALLRLTPKAIAKLTTRHLIAYPERWNDPLPDLEDTIHSVNAFTSTVVEPNLTRLLFSHRCALVPLPRGHPSCGTHLAIDCRDVGANDPDQICLWQEGVCTKRCVIVRLLNLLPPSKDHLEQQPYSRPEHFLDTVEGAEHIIVGAAPSQKDTAEMEKTVVFLVPSTYTTFYDSRRLDSIVNEQASTHQIYHHRPRRAPSAPLKPEILRNAIKPPHKIASLSVSLAHAARQLAAIVLSDTNSCGIGRYEKIELNAGPFRKHVSGVVQMGYDYGYYNDYSSKQRRMSSGGGSTPRSPSQS